MPSHHWMQQLSVIAICPKCQSPTLRRSHSMSSFEKYRKQRTSKRIYRCHNCSWRGWLNENELRFPPVSMIEIPSQAIDDSILLPEVRLDDVVIGLLEGNQGASMAGKHDTPFQASGDAVQPHAGDKAEHATIVLPRETVFAEPAPGTLHVPEFGNSGPTSHPVTEGHESRHRRSGRKCPLCKTEALFRSHAKGFEKVVKYLRPGKRVYRCHECNWRGWLPKR